MTDARVKVALEGVDFAYSRGLGGTDRREIVLDKFSLTCPASRITAILGPSGCGKSTILDLVAGLRRPEGGRIAITSAGSPAKPRAGFIFQRENCLPWLRIRENLTFGLDAPGPDFEAIVARLQLAALLDKFPHELSGGQQQRIAIGRLLIRRPNLILCDEPWSSLDIASRRLAEDQVRDLIRQMDATCILVTHEPSEALRVADVVVVLSGKPVRIVQQFDVTPEQRADPRAVERFIDDYVEILRRPDACDIYPDLTAIVPSRAGDSHR